MAVTSLHGLKIAYPVYGKDDNDDQDDDFSTPNLMIRMFASWMPGTQIVIFHKVQFIC